MQKFKALTNLILNRRMSIVPTQFRDVFDNDFVTPFRRASTDILDPNFFDDIRRRHDLMISKFLHPSQMQRSDYIRPWTTSFQENDSVNVDKDKFQVILDVQHFTPNEISVKTSEHDKFITVEGKHEEKPDEHGYIERHFVRRYGLPDHVNHRDITSRLSSDGILTITAPIKHQIKEHADHFIPIEQEGKNGK